MSEQMYAETKGKWHVMATISGGTALARAISPRRKPPEDMVLIPLFGPVTDPKEIFRAEEVMRMHLNGLRAEYPHLNVFKLAWIADEPLD
jgi:hypothetical protein